MSEQKDEQREVSVELTVQCAECQSTLEAVYKPPLNSYQEANKVSGVLVVKPCSRCLDRAECSAYDNGHEEGYERGLAEGSAENDDSNDADQTD